jgi:hypothetical protein
MTVQPLRAALTGELLLLGSPGLRRRPAPGDRQVRQR